MTVFAQDVRQTLLSNLRGDVVALENDMRHVDTSAGLLVKQDETDLALLADKLGWWQDCAKKQECWEWVKPSGSP